MKLTPQVISILGGFAFFALATVLTGGNPVGILVGLVVFVLIALLLPSAITPSSDERRRESLQESGRKLQLLLQDRRLHPDLSNALSRLQAELEGLLSGFNKLGSDGKFQLDSELLTKQMSLGQLLITIQDNATALREGGSGEAAINDVVKTIDQLSRSIGRILNRTIAEESGRTADSIRLAIQSVSLIGGEEDLEEVTNENK